MYLILAAKTEKFSQCQTIFCYCGRFPRLPDTSDKVALHIWRAAPPVILVEYDLLKKVII